MVRRLVLATAALFSFFVVNPTSASAVPDPIGLWASPSEIKVYVEPSARDKGWQITRTIKTWSVGPVTIKGVSAPCVTCISIMEIPPGGEYQAAAIFDSNHGVMEYCRVELSSNIARYVRPYAAAHEIGHCLGLPHINEKTSVMDHRGRNALEHKMPQPYDIEWLTRIYS